MKLNVERMRYKNDSFSFWMCMLSLICDVIQFMFIYSNIYLQTLTGKGEFKYYMIGVDVVVNILFMLAAFYIGEELKTYHRNWALVAALVGIVQLVRIGIFPAQLLQFEFITNALHTKIKILMILSALFMFAAAVISFIKSTMLMNFLKKKGELK